MIDGGTPDLDQDLIARNRWRRYIVEHQLPTVFQQSDSSHAKLSLSLPNGRHARGHLRIQNTPVVFSEQSDVQA
jgi:hypothetical protein